MARIRSIKPEFFQSETIAELPVTARLTFIGLWTHVDDNGVCLDNPKLIKAAVWPLEDDPTMALKRTQEDLHNLQAAGLIVRYLAPDGRKLLFVAHWDEHQKVSHPRAARYVRPTPEQCRASPTSMGSDFRSPPENLPTSSGGSPEDRQSPPENLRPEQGAGSREQGTEEPSPPDEPAGADEPLFEPATGDYPPALPSTAPGRAWSNDQIDADPHWAAFWEAYPRKTDKGHARKAWLKALRNKVDPALITNAAERFRDDPKRNRDLTYVAHPTTWLNGERFHDYDQDDAAPVGPPAFWNA